MVLYPRTGEGWSGSNPGAERIGRERQGEEGVGKVWPGRARHPKAPLTCLTAGEGIIAQTRPGSNWHGGEGTDGEGQGMAAAWRGTAPLLV